MQARRDVPEAPHTMLLKACAFPLQVDSFSYGVVLWEIITKERSQRGNWRPVRVPEECPAEVDVLLQVSRYGQHEAAAHPCARWMPCPELTTPGVPASAGPPCPTWTDLKAAPETRTRLCMRRTASRMMWSGVRA